MSAMVKSVKNSVFWITSWTHAFPLGVEVSPFAIRRLLSTGLNLGLRPSGIFSNTRGLRTDNVLPVSNKASIGIPHTSTLINRPFSSMDLALVVGLSSSVSIHVAEAWPAAPATGSFPGSYTVWSYAPDYLGLKHSRCFDSSCVRPYGHYENRYVNHNDSGGNYYCRNVGGCPE